ncbi:MAG: hypothetical protein HPY59_17930 [Anaerolineae bacterium]|nr:hypothetical protein [Anaerolineae bacterium]
MMWTQHIWSSATQTVKDGLQRWVVATLREYYYKAYFFIGDIPVRWSDFLWLLFLPGYMLVDTLRHELSHALAAWLMGVRVLTINIIPGRQLGYFSFGYVILDENANWLVVAAPYFCDLALFVAVFGLIRFRRFERRWVYINLVMMGLLSPLYNSLSGFINSKAIYNDVARLMMIFSEVTISYVFLFVILFYLIALRKLYRLWLFNSKYQVPFWHAWAAGKRAFRRSRIL